MDKRILKDITLIGLDCVNLERLQQAAEICQEAFEFAHVKLLSSIPSEDPRVIKIQPINSTEEYSKFILSELDNYFGTSHVLIFQYDGFILNPTAWTDKFLQYDYIGAPWLVADWAVKNFDFPENLLGQLVVGNGGFSLRSKKLTMLCKDMMTDGRITRYHPEDTAIGVYYREEIELQGIKFAPVPLAQQFSFEGNKDEKWDGQFGFHGLDWTDISSWTKQHPKYNIINPAANK